MLDDVTVDVMGDAGLDVTRFVFDAALMRCWRWGGVVVFVIVVAVFAVRRLFALLLRQRTNNARYLLTIYDTVAVTVHTSGLSDKMIKWLRTRTESRRVRKKSAQKSVLKRAHYRLVLYAVGSGRSLDDDFLLDINEVGELLVTDVDVRRVDLSGRCLVHGGLVSSSLRVQCNHVKWHGRVLS